MRTPFPQSTHLPRARLIGSLVEYDKEFLPSLKSQSPSLHRRRTSACLHFHRACAPHPRTEHREYHSASTRRPRSCWQWRYKLGRRPRVTKVRTSHSHPFHPLLARHPALCPPPSALDPLDPLSSCTRLHLRSRSDLPSSSRLRDLSPPPTLDPEHARSLIRRQSLTQLTGSGGTGGMAAAAAVVERRAGNRDRRG